MLCVAKSKFLVYAYGSQMLNPNYTAKNTLCSELLWCTKQTILR